MASTIRIKRSTVSGNPSALAAGEMAYSALTDNGSNGGDRLYIGIGTETAGNATNHYVIGGKYFTDMLDQSPGTLTASSAIVIDSNSKINNINVGNITLTGSTNTISSTDTNGNIVITPNGTGKTIITNPYIGDNATPLSEYIYDTVGGAITAGTGVTITNSDIGNTSTISITNTTVSANTYGSATAVPIITVNAQGQLTAVTTAAVASNLNISGDTGTDAVSLLTDTLIFIGGNGLTSAITNNTVTLNIDTTVVTLADTQTLQNKTLTLPTIGSTGAKFNGSSSGTITVLATATAGVNSLTLPAATDTLVGKATTDTFTNKTFNTAGTGNSFSINSNAITAYTGTGATVVLATTPSISGGINFTGSISGQTTLTTNGAASGILTLPAATDTLVGKATTDIFTNKSISGSTNTFTNIGNSALVNTSVTFGSTTVALGAVSTTLIGLTELAIDNININGNTISSTNTNGNISLDPNGTGTVDVNGARITNLATPTTGNDAVTRDYVDNKITGLTWKQAAHLLAIGNVPLTGTIAAMTALNIDGHGAIGGNYRLLLLGQITPSDNGIYDYVESGANYTLTRSADASVYSELLGASIFIQEGTVYAKTGWVQSNSYLTSFSGQSWVQFSGAGAYTAGDGLGQTGTTFFVQASATGGIEVAADYLQLKSTVAGDGLTLTSGVLDVVGTASRITSNANSIDIASTYVGQSSITTLGTITTGVWSGTVIASAKGGTGVSNSSTITLGGNISTAGAFSTSGAFAITLTATAITSVTLPITGTLSTLAGSEALSNKTITASSFSGTTVAASGNITFTSVTDASALGTAPVVLSGGLSVAKAIYVGTNITGAGNGTSTLDGFNIDGGTY